jgi:hypothetical protein
MGGGNSTNEPDNEEVERMRRGHRWMYWATGLPGWMRYGAGYHGGPWGYGPGPGWAGGMPYAYGPWEARPTKEDELAFLKDEAESVREYLEEVEQRISELETVETKEGS